MQAEDKTIFHRMFMFMRIDGLYHEFHMIYLNETILKCLWNESIIVRTYACVCKLGMKNE